LLGHFDFTETTLILTLLPIARMFLTVNIKLKIVSLLEFCLTSWRAFVNSSGFHQLGLLFVNDARMVVVKFFYYFLTIFFSHWVCLLTARIEIVWWLANRFLNTVLIIIILWTVDCGCHLLVAGCLTLSLMTWRCVTLSVVLSSESSTRTRSVDSPPSGGSD